MLVFLFLFLSFLQVGALSVGGDASAQALVEHEVITLHHWLTPAQMADLMTFCRVLPGGAILSTASLNGSLAVAARFGFWGSVGASYVSVLGLCLPAAAWTAIVNKLHTIPRRREWIVPVMTVLRPLVPGLIAGAALLLMREENFGMLQQTPWGFFVSVFLFLSTLIGVGIYRFNALFMIILCGVAGWLLL